MLCEAGIRRLPIIALSVCGVSMIGYKAKQAGVEIVLVEPRYISQTCSRCLHIGIHLDQSKFHCRNCGLQLNADLIGAKSIALGHEAASSANIRRSKSTGPKRSVLRRERASETVVSLRQNGVGPEKNCADAILPKGHIELISIKVEFGRLITAQRNRRNFWDWL
jgi:Putative transposase DNA-binding domain